MGSIVLQAEGESQGSETEGVPKQLFQPITKSAYLKKCRSDDTVEVTDGVEPAKYHCIRRYK